MKILVTGAGGFIGSSLCEALLSAGHQVNGLDAFIPYYPKKIKEYNLQNCLSHPNFNFFELDLRYSALPPALEGVDAIIHEAAMAGLNKSWTEFENYVSCNLLGTQKLLEQVKKLDLKKFIHISTSSVYGRIATGTENSSLNPISPYGVTKLAAEKLAMAYYHNFNLPVVVLRYFSIYGPRQRPDMGYHIFIRSLLKNELITIYGDGKDIRSNTYIDDCVKGTILALENGQAGEIYNIGGGETIDVNTVINMLEEITGQKAHIEYKSARPGEQRVTTAEISKARQELGYQPQTSIREGLAKQVAWQKTIQGESF